MSHVFHLPKYSDIWWRRRENRGRVDYEVWRGLLTGRNGYELLSFSFLPSLLCILSSHWLFFLKNIMYMLGLQLCWWSACLTCRNPWIWSVTPPCKLSVISSHRKKARLGLTNIFLEHWFYPADFKDYFQFVQNGLYLQKKLFWHIRLVWNCVQFPTLWCWNAHIFVTLFYQMRLCSLSIQFYICHTICSPLLDRHGNDFSFLKAS